MSTTRSVKMSAEEKAVRNALRKRVRQFYHRFNKGAWEECYALIDPKLTKHSRVSLGTYAELMQRFKSIYGIVKSRWTDISLHLEATPKQRDDRPFAYVYMLWQDEAYGFHMFRERWIQDDGQWYTRVVGLVPNQNERGADQN